MYLPNATISPLTVAIALTAAVWLLNPSSAAAQQRECASVRASLALAKKHGLNTKTLRTLEATYCPKATAQQSARAELQKRCGELRAMRRMTRLTPLGAKARDMVAVTTADGNFPIVDGCIVAPTSAGLGIMPRLDVLGEPVATYA